MRSSVRLIVIAVIIALALSCVCSATASAAGGDVRKQIRVESRPGAGGPPTKVKVGLYIIDVGSIDDADRSFIADVYAIVQWRDKRLAGKGFRRVDVNDLVWYPNLLMLNKRSALGEYDDIVTIDNDGMILYEQRFYGAFSLPLNLHNFPFDKHEIPFKIVTAGQGAEDVELTVADTTGRSQDLSIADWMIGDVESDLSTYFFEPRNEQFNLMTFKLDAHRRVGFYVFRIILPLVLIVFMSWMVFYIDPSHLEAQVGISATSILTLIAFQFTVGVLLPRIGYLTRMDKFILFSSVLVFLALVEGVTTSALASKGRRELALKFDFWSRILFPTVFVLLILVAFVF